MPSDGPYLLGEDLTAVSITPVTVAANGSFSNGSTTPLTAFIMNVEGTLEQQVEDVRPVNQPGINEVPHSYGDSVTLGCLERSDDLNALQSIIRANRGSSRRFLIAWTQGAEDFAGYYTFRRMGYGVTSRGQNVITAEFGPCTPTDASQMSYS